MYVPFIINIRTIFHNIYVCSLAIAMKPKSKENFRTAAML